MDSDNYIVSFQKSNEKRAIIMLDTWNNQYHINTQILKLHVTNILLVNKRRKKTIKIIIKQITKLIFFENPII